MWHVGGCIARLALKGGRVVWTPHVMMKQAKDSQGRRSDSTATRSETLGIVVLCLWTCVGAIGRRMWRPKVLSRGGGTCKT